MKAKQLAVGSVVRLKSGGPNMTIVDATGDQVECVWFTPNDHSNLRMHWFYMTSLEQVK